MTRRAKEKYKTSHVRIRTNNFVRGPHSLVSIFSRGSDRHATMTTLKCYDNGRKFALPCERIPGAQRALHYDYHHLLTIIISITFVYHPVTKSELVHIAFSQSLPVLFRLHHFSTTFSLFACPFPLSRLPDPSPSPTVQSQPGAVETILVAAGWVLSQLTLQGRGERDRSTKYTRKWGRREKSMMHLGSVHSLFVVHTHSIYKDHIQCTYTYPTKRDSHIYWWP